ncbi:MAG: HEAT repeat domain-containing protein [Gemmataceae bacterium]|nr:HEAT repeat domain-containing protein [Gemmataceae bacterium]
MRATLVMFVALVLTTAASAQSGSSSIEKKEITEVGGRSFDQWLKDIGHKDPSRREAAIRAVMAFGPDKAYEAVPAMLAELRRQTIGGPSDTSVRVNLAIALGAILGAKQEKDRDPKHVKEAVALLARLLSDSQGIVKFRAAQALTALEFEAISAVPELLPLLKDRLSYEVRQAGAAALGRIAFDRKIGVLPHVANALKDLLTDQAFQVRQTACQSLGALGPPGDPNVRLAVLRALEPVAKKDPEPTVQIWANVAVMRYAGKPSEENIAPIAQFLHKGDTAARMNAAQALGALGTAAKDTVPTLIAALDDVDPGVVGMAIWALGRMESGRALPALERVAANAKLPDELKKAARMTIDELKKKLASSS